MKNESSMLDGAAPAVGDQPALALREPSPRRVFKCAARGGTFGEHDTFLFGIENKRRHAGPRAGIRGGKRGKRKAPGSPKLDAAETFP
jgi:hypothetical protein